MSADPVSGQALVVLGPHDVVLEQRTATAAKAGEVTVRPHHVGLCGTDLEIVNGDLDPVYVHYPLVLGHEWSGRVVEVGAGVDDLNPGDPVVVEGILACGRCEPCRAGRTNLCANYDELGFTLDGAAGPAVTVPATFVHRLADDVQLEAGVLVEPGAVVLRGLLELNLVPGLRVLVIGDGTVALLAAHLVQMWAPSVVDMAGRRSEQVDLAKTMGVHHFVVTAPAVQAYDIVIEAAGSTTAVETALRSADRGGQVLLLGIAGHENTAAVPVDDVVNNDLTIRGSFSYTAKVWAETVRLLNTGTFRPLPLITHRYDLTEYAQAFAMLAGGSGTRGKVLFDLMAEA